MINHGYAPPEFLHSSMIPLAKGARADLSNSDMYRSIAISSLLSKIFDNVVIERHQDFLSTSNYQFGFKARAFPTEAPLQMTFIALYNLYFIVYVV